MSVRVDARHAIDGLSRLASALPQAGATARRVSADSGVHGAKAKVHVITGRLRDSIRVMRETPDTTSFGSDLHYAATEEFRVGGTRGDHSYMRPEYNRLQTYYPEQFIMQLRRVF